MTRREAADTGKSEPERQPIVESLPLSLIDKPLDYILADHFRTRSVCAVLKRFAGEGRADQHQAAMVKAFLGNELLLHHEDEDHDLFPALLRRALPEDELSSALAQLSKDHRCLNAFAETIRQSLSGADCVKPISLDQQSRTLMQGYAINEHRHLAIENGIIMAIARIRLKSVDLRNISNAMKLRRGMLSDVAHT
jgi:hypothetical protein